MARILCNEIIIQETAQELGMSIAAVRKIIATQSEYTKEVIESGTFDRIRWPYLGSFNSKPKEVQMINHIKGLNEDQAREFKHAVRTGKIKFNLWEKKKKAKPQQDGTNTREE